MLPAKKKIVNVTYQEIESVIYDNQKIKTLKTGNFNVDNLTNRRASTSC